jgi:hypothetical protein
MLNISTFGYTADVYKIIHFIPHTYQHITVDQIHSSGDTDASPARGLSRRVSLSIGVRIILTSFVVYLLRIF